MRHGLDHDGITRINDQPRQFRIVEPPPLRRFQSSRQYVYPARVLRSGHKHELLRSGKGGWRLLRSCGASGADKH
jgi:hypothetical protein